MVKTLLWSVFVVAFASCASFGPRSASGEASERVEKVLTTAKSLLGNKPNAKVKVKGRSFVLDCIGTVSASYWGAGIDVQKDFSLYQQNGVNRLYETLRAKGALHWNQRPSPGDIVFWDRTWDTGNDPQYASGHTHAGIVVSVDENDTITYLHESVTRGVVLSKMNLRHPSDYYDDRGQQLNSPMFLGSSLGKKTNPPKWLSGDLWSAFGDAEVAIAALGANP